MKRFTITAASMLFLATPAHAVTIKNVDRNNSYTLTVTDGGEAREVTIPPWGIYRTPGPFVKVEMAGQKPYRVERYSELMIKNGKLSLQRRTSRRGD